MKHLLPIWLALAFAVCAAPPLPSGAVKLPVVADANVSAHASEINLNYGHSSHLRLKGHEMMMLVKFDTTPVRGWTVERASLFLHAAGPHKLKTIGVSTVATDWIEGDGRGTPVTSGVTFTWADFGQRQWGGRQSDFTDAALTAQGTEVHDTNVKPHDDDWLEIEVPPRFVHALINGDSFGLAVVDEKGQTRANSNVHSREQSGCEPFLAVVGKPTGQTPPTQRVAPAPPPPRPRSLALAAANVITWPGGEPPMRDGQLRVWAYGDCEKANPITGNLLEAVGASDYRKLNAVWDGASSTVHLAAARNEFVAFHLCFEAITGQLANVHIEADVPGARVALFKDWHVKDGEWFPEVAVPLAGAFAIPDDRNGIAGQRNQSVLVELYVPHIMPAGRHAGRVRIAADGVTPFEIPVVINVWDFALPDVLSFDVDLNAYGAPGDAVMELKFHRLAHEHRATLNILGYNQSGKPKPDYAPPLAGAGKDMRVADWSAFDARHGRYFDGSAFADLPRRSVPVTHAYLPFCESWPSDIGRHYRHTPTETTYQEMITGHALRTPPVEEAFDQEFKDEFTAVLRQFAAHFRERGWSRTQFQFFFNNKHFFRDPKQGGRGSSWWLLDEPMHRDDWLALQFFGRMLKDVLAQTPNPNFIFRADAILPWNSLGPDSSFDRPTPTTLLYGGGRFSIAGPLASLRLKAMRRGQQDVEYLALLAAKRGWDREQTAAAVAPLLRLDARTQESFVDDAGRTVFENLSSEQFARLRESVAAAISGAR